MLTWLIALILMWPIAGALQRRGWAPLPARLAGLLVGLALGAAGPALLVMLASGS